MHFQAHCYCLHIKHYLEKKLCICIYSCIPFVYSLSFPFLFVIVVQALFLYVQYMQSIIFEMVIAVLGQLVTGAMKFTNIHIQLKI